MKPITGAIKLTRPLNCIAAFGCTLLGGFLSPGLDRHQLWVAAFVIAILVAAANVVNDYFDIESDRINKPLRPLPTKQLSLAAARNLGVTLVVLGIGLSLSLDTSMVLVALVMGVLLYAYSLKLKRVLLLGNVVVSVLSASTIIYGGMAVRSIGPTLAPALLMLMFVFCREVLKTAEDYEGDIRVGARTIAVAWGKTKALLVFSGLVLLVILLSFLPWLANDQLSAMYLLIIVPTGDVILLTAAYILLKRPDSGNIKRALIGTKATIFIWLIAMFLGLMFAI